MKSTLFNRFALLLNFQNVCKFLFRGLVSCKDIHKVNNKSKKKMALPYMVCNSSIDNIDFNIISVV